MLRKQWKMMKTILLTGTSLLLSVILSAGAHTPQISDDLDPHTWAERNRTIFTLNEPLLSFQLPPLFAYQAGLNPRMTFTPRMFELPLQRSILLQHDNTDTSAVHSILPTPQPQVLTPQMPSQQLQVLTTSPKPPVQQAITPTAPYQRYVTTAYFLNVREESNNKSKIIDVVEKGDILRVTHILDNGWLQLYDEGFVHGGYAELVETQTDAGTRTLAGEKQYADIIGLMQTAQLSPSPKPEKPTSNVQSKSGLTKDHIAQILKGTELTDKEIESAVLEIEDEYGINAYFTIAVMKLESGNGKSRLAKVKNNLFGLNATGGSNAKAYAFDTKADSVRKFGQLIANSYVGKGLTTIEKVARKYCPPNEDWPNLVQRIMKSDHKKLMKSDLI